MMEKSPPRYTPPPDADGASSAPAPEGEPEVKTQEDEASSDPYDDLWDPDMDTRPERIKRTKARARPDVRGRGRSAPRGKRKEEG